MPKRPEHKKYLTRRPKPLTTHLRDSGTFQKGPSSLESLTPTFEGLGNSVPEEEVTPPALHGGRDGLGQFGGSQLPVSVSRSIHTRPGGPVIHAERSVRFRTPPSRQVRKQNWKRQSCLPRTPRLPSSER